jgi:hypothetical protein
MADRFSIIDYGKRLEKVLLAQRDVSAIIQHTGEIGTAREFFVESILKRFLPANIVIGRGEIVDGEGGRSRQQDLLLYRSNFPVIDSLAGAHIYLAEGVLATIEVKSRLDGEEVIRATQNIASVRSLKLSMVGLGKAETVEGGPLTLDDLRKENVAARIMAGRDPMPGTDPLLVPAEERIWTYVFAFDGVGHDTLMGHADTNGWLKGAGPDCLCVLGKAFGATGNSPIRCLREPTAGEVFLIDAHSEPLGWWLGHLVWALRRSHREPFLRPYFGDK